MAKERRQCGTWHPARCRSRFSLEFQLRKRKAGKSVSIQNSAFQCHPGSVKSPVFVPLQGNNLKHPMQEYSVLLQKINIPWPTGHAAPVTSTFLSAIFAHCLMKNG
ncbi:MAG TPA: hypothetical protein ENJ23_03465 [Bacteroidetes bacterium]|nr:hypothetical protein [Bacteroidota bacterium]